MKTERIANFFPPPQRFPFEVLEGIQTWLMTSLCPPATTTEDPLLAHFPASRRLRDRGWEGCAGAGLRHVR